jgi:hypothetical protein
MQNHNPYRDRSVLIRLLGGAMLVVGVAASLIGPMEVYTYNLFTEGGRFHYEGFNFGSLMFGNITIQVAGYYLIAALAIVLGAGHLALRRWVRKLVLTLVAVWLVLGLPLAIVAFLMLLTAKDLPPSSLPFLIVSFVLVYPILPLLLRHFYHSRDVETTFAAHDPREGWLEETPLRILVLSSLLICFGLALHVPMLFNGLFPLFTGFLSGLEGLQALGLSALLMAFLAWGVLVRKLWAWWGALMLLGFLLLSAIAAFLTTDPASIWARTHFAPLEMEMVQNMPLQGYMLALFAGGPVLITMILLATSRRFFTTQRQPEIA